MKKIGTRALSIVISILMVIYLVPTSVFANMAQNLSDRNEDIDNTEAAGIIRDVFEVTDRREETVKHFRLEDGSYTAVQYDVPVHYMDEDGEWQDIDNRLESSGSEYSTGNARIKFAKKITGNETLFTLHDGNRKITMSLDGAIKKTAGQVTNTETEFDGNATKLQKLMTLDNLSSRIMYEDILDGVDLEYVVESLNVKENIIVKDRKDSYSYTFTVKLNNLEAELNEDGSVRIYDPDSEEMVYVIPAPVVYDANMSYADSSDAFYTLTKTGGNEYKLTVTADADWMNVSGRAFPVTVDPAVCASVSTPMTDTYVDSDNPTYTYYTYDFLAAGHGSAGQDFISYWKVNTLPVIPDNSYISSAKLELYCQDLRPHSTAAGLKLTLGAYKVTSDWTSGATWNSVSSGSKGACSTILDYAVISENTYIGWDITSLYEEWDSGTANHGVAIKQIGGDNIDALFTSENASSNRPRLIVNYRDMSGLESYWSYTTQNAGLAGTGYVNNATGNLVLTVDTLSTTDGLFGFTPTLVYNSDDVGERGNPYKYITAGDGWRLNIQESITWETVKDSNDDEVTLYKWYDSDGTEHCFTFSENIHLAMDEDGLGLTMTNQDSNNYIEIYYKDGSIKRFTKYSATASMEECALLSYIMDAYGNKILFHYENLTLGRIAVTSIGIQPNGSTEIPFFELKYSTTGNLYEIKNLANDRKVTLEYSSSFTSNEISIIYSTALRRITFSHGSSNTTDAVVNYRYASDGMLLSARDMLNNIEIDYTYDDGNKVNTATERTYDDLGVTTRQGQRVGFTYANKYTEVRSSGSDDVYGNGDDIINCIVFDREGRVKSAYSTNEDRDTIYGGTSGEYETEDELSRNSIKTSAVVGGSSNNFLLNGGFELEGDGIPYWTVSSSGEGIVSLSSPVPANELSRKDLFITPLSGTHSVTQYVKLPNGSYTLSFDYNVYGGGENVDVEIILDSVTVSGRSYGKDLAVNLDNAAMMTFESITFEADGSEGYEIFMVGFKVSGNANTEDSTGVSADNFMLENNIGSSNYSLVQYGHFDQTATNSSGAVLYNPESFWDGDYSYTYVGSNFGRVLYIEGGLETTRQASQVVFEDKYISGQTPAVKGTYVISGFARGTQQVINASGIFRLKVEVLYDGETDPETFYYDFVPSCTTWQFISGTFKIDGKPEKITVSCEYGKHPGHALFDNIYVAKSTDDGVVDYMYSNGHVVMKTTPVYEESYVYVGDDMTYLLNSLGYSYDYEYNDMHDIVSEIYTTFDYYSDPEYDEPQHQTDYTYNSYGLVTRVDTYDVTLSSAGEVEKPDDAKTLRNTYTYITASGSKMFGLLESETNTAGKTTTYKYYTAGVNIGALNQVIYPGNTQGLYYEYDMMGRMTAVYPLYYNTGFNVLMANTSDEFTKYIYDEHNRLESVSSATTTYSFTYDDYGNTASVKAGDETLATYEYNANNGKLKKLNYGNGVTVRYEYDDLDRVSKIWYTEENGTEELQYEYTYSSGGQITKVDDYANDTCYVYKYDGAGRAVGYVQYDTNDMASDVGISWTYDEKSQLTNSIIGFDYIYDTSSIHYGELEYKYAYDPNGNVKDVEIDAADSVEGEISNSNYTLGGYNTRVIKFGSVSSRTFTNTVNVEYGTWPSNTSFDSGLIESYSTKVNSNTATTYTYTYDVRGNITQIVDNTGKVTKYYYDDIGQLTREDNPYLNKSYSYTYDKNGNRISKSTYQYTTAATLPSELYQSYEYWQYGNDDWGDQLTSYMGTPITYDEIGNPLTYSNYEFEWENGRQLKKITVGLGMSVYEYTYNDEGIRTSKKVTGTTHYYTLNGSQILTEQWGNIFIVYLYDESGSPIGMQYRTKSMAEGTFYTYLFEKNLQGDIIAVYNTSGTKLVSYVYDAWGNVTVTNHNVSGTNSGARHNPFRYRGYYYDTETGYYYLQSRYYNPEWGRFLNADSTGYLGANGDLISYNLYAYCSNNPVMYVDPTGEWNWGKFWDGFVTFGSTAVGIAVGVYTGLQIAATTGNIGAAITGGVAAGSATTGFINNTVNAIYYEFSDGESNLSGDSYVNDGYITRWDRLDYTKQQTGESHYNLNAWRYNSEYGLHMYGWMATGWADEKNIFLISEIAEHCEYAHVDKTEWDSRPEVLIPTIVIGILGY